MEDNGELPEGWATALIPDVCKLNPSKPKAADHADELLVTFVPMPAVDADAGAITKPQLRPFSEVRKGFTAFRNEDVILAKITPCMENGKAAVVRGLSNGLGFGSTEFHVLRSNGAVGPDFLFHFLRQESFRNGAEKEMTGSVGQKRVPAEYLEQVELPVPPLAEQRRIVAAVEVVLAKVNAARERLNRVPAILKRFRQAVLSAACSGRLTTDWRGDIGAAVDSLPPAWESVPLRTISSRVTDGTHLPPPLAAAGIPFVLIGNVVGKKIDWTGVRKWVTQETYEQLTARCKPERGDVLYTAVGATYGQALVIETDRHFIFQRHIAHVKPLHNRVNPSYLVQALNSPELYQHATEVARGAAQPTVTLADLKEFAIPLPPLAEQQEIVRRVSDLFALADVIESRLTDARRMADQLTQAVLAKAFRGELVPTEAELARRENRTYEPASDLLARIRAEREQHAAPANGKPKRTRKPKAGPV